MMSAGSTSFNAHMPCFPHLTRCSLEPMDVPMEDLSLSERTASNLFDRNVRSLIDMDEMETWSSLPSYILRASIEPDEFWSNFPIWIPICRFAVLRCNLTGLKQAHFTGLEAHIQQTLLLLCFNQISLFKSFSFSYWQ